MNGTRSAPARASRSGLTAALLAAMALGLAGCGTGDENDAASMGMTAVRAW